MIPGPPSAIPDAVAWSAVYPDGVERGFLPPDLPLWRLLWDAAARTPAAPAIHFRDRTLTYEDLRRMATAAASRIAAGPGERVLLHLANVPEFVAAYHGALRRGAAVVAVGPDVGSRAFGEILADAEPSVVVVSGTRTGAGVPPGARTVTVTPGGGFGPSPAREPPPARCDPARDVAVLQYTSGTTGGMKAAMMSHRNLVANALQNDLWFGWTPDDVILGALPLCHTWGMCCVMNAALAAGASVALVEAFDAGEILRTVRDRHVTVIYGSATMFHRLLDAAGPAAAAWFASVRYVKAGAMLVGTDLLARWSAAVPGVPMVTGYGLTEASPEVTDNPLDAPRDGTVGVPLPGTDLRIRDPERPEDPVPAGTAGEIQVCGPQVMLGYWRRPEATAPTLLPGGWLRTGDLGRLDEAGYLVVVDRIKDMLKFRGVSVVPAAVERVILGHPDVVEVCVVGRPDPVEGDVPTAFVVLRQGASAGPEDLRAHAVGHLSSHEVPRGWHFVTEIPKSAVGKPLRRALRERASRR